MRIRLGLGPLSPPVSMYSGASVWIDQPRPSPGQFIFNFPTFCPHLECLIMGQDRLHSTAELHSYTLGNPSLK